MMKKLFALFALSAILIACAAEEVNVAPAIKPTEPTNTFEATDVLPTLTLTLGEETIATSTGTYSWNYEDPTTGQLTGIEAASLAPFEIVRAHDATAFNTTQAATVQFDVDPDKVEIRLWDDEKVVKTYHSFNDVTETGRYAVEIVGTWDAGRVTYVTAVEFP